MEQKNKKSQESKPHNDDNNETEFLELNQAIANIIENQLDNNEEDNENEEEQGQDSIDYSSQNHNQNQITFSPVKNLDNYHRAYLSSPVRQSKFGTPNLIQRTMNYPFQSLPNNQHYFGVNRNYGNNTMNHDFTFSPPVYSFQQYGSPQPSHFSNFSNCFAKYNNNNTSTHNHNHNHKINFFFENGKNNNSSGNEDDQQLNKMINKQNKSKKGKKQKGTTQSPNMKSLFANPNMNINNQSNGGDEEKNKIFLDGIMQGIENRTTLMIKNIPNKYTIGTFLEEINLDYLNKYDVFYLPIDYGNKCNLGFAFINFVEPMHIVDFYDTYRGKKWKRFNSEKICDLVYAKIQGKKELISHFEKGKVLSFESEDKRPLILATPLPLPKIIIPMKLMHVLTLAYPFATYHPISPDKMLIDSLYNE